MDENKPNGTGIGRIIRAGRCSILGLRAALRHEQAFGQELLLCVVMAPLGLWLGEDGLERALLLGPLLILLIVELLNSAIEAVVDRVGTEHHELSGRAKDLASAAVLLAIVNIIGTWLLVLL
jgi:diacylglycerol kinase (ATP)